MARLQSRTTDFYPRSPCGERPYGRINDISRLIFLSTLSLRRATTGHVLAGHRRPYFYPRSPCGERRQTFACWYIKERFLSTLSLRRATIYANTWTLAKAISIHALLAESDRAEMQPLAPRSRFLSTLSLRRATDDLKVPASVSKISIHALLAESDPW